MGCTPSRPSRRSTYNYDNTLGPMPSHRRHRDHDEEPVACCRQSPEVGSRFAELHEHQDMGRFARDLGGGERQRERRREREYDEYY